MADASRTRSSVNGIVFIGKPREGTDGALGEHEVVYEQLLNCDCYAGTATALIKAGIIEEHMLPGQPNRGKHITLIEGPDGEKWGAGYIEITRYSARLFEVRVGISGDESGRRQQARHRRLQAEQAAAKLAAAQQREARELSELPRTHRQYREMCVKTLRAHLGIVRNTALARNKFSGFYFDSEALREFDRVASELLKTLDGGTTVFDPAMQERRIIEIRSQSSKVNLPLQVFLKELSVRTDGAEEPTD